MSLTAVTLRLAKPSDGRALARLHCRSRTTSSVGFFSQVSESFLRYYYKVVLDDPYSVVMCAEASDGQLLGFASGTLDAERHFARIRSHRLMFGLLLLPSMLARPSLIMQTMARFGSSKGGSGRRYVVTRGARTENWVWVPRDGTSIWAGVLNNTHLKMLRILGAEEVHFEVDVDNTAVVRFSVGNGAKLIDCIELDDGRRRNIYRYDLVQKFSGLARGR
jgi:hypothetical protein